MKNESENLLNEFQAYADFCNAFADNFLEGSRIVKLLLSANNEIVKKGHLIDHLSGKLSNVISSQGSTFVELNGDEKSEEYLSLENEYRVNKLEFRELKTAYLKFLKKSLVSEVYAQEDDIVDPTVKTGGNFRYPVVSEKLRYMIFYLRQDELRDFSGARKFARDKISRLSGDQHTQLDGSVRRLFALVNGALVG